MTAIQGPTKVDNMIKVLRDWQAIERQAINDTAEIMEKSDNPMIRMVMEIIRHDSIMHHRVQQFLIDSVTKEAVTVSRDDVAAIWEKIEAHDAVERKAIELAKGLREEAWSPVHKQLLDYLIKDETKHDSLLEQLGQLKQGMDRTSGG